MKNSNGIFSLPKRMKLPRAFLIFFICLKVNSYCQILHTESFTVILDTTRTIQGTIMPDFNFQNLKNDLIEFENTADLSVRFSKSAITIANKIELSKFGEETIVSGGYLYSEFRKTIQRRLALELYSQVHWSEARGMERKYAGGINVRWHIIHDNNIFGLYAGIGPFLEFERWNYDGVSNNNLIPIDAKKIENRDVKVGSYISVKYFPLDQLFIDLSVYYQSRFDELTSAPRFASSSRVTYNFTRYFGLSLIYQSIYDPRPVVPIDKLYNHVTAGLTISF